jgi:hypothetical protein
VNQLTDATEGSHFGVLIAFRNFGNDRIYPAHGSSLVAEEIIDTDTDHSL